MREIPDLLFLEVDPKCRSNVKNVLACFAKLQSKNVGRIDAGKHRSSLTKDISSVRFAFY